MQILSISYERAGWVVLGCPPWLLLGCMVLCWLMYLHANFISDGVQILLVGCCINRYCMIGLVFLYACGVNAYEKYCANLSNGSHFWEA